jgi:hypothetical protein
MEGKQRRMNTENRAESLRETVPREPRSFEPHHVAAVLRAAICGPPREGRCGGNLPPAKASGPGVSLPSDSEARRLRVGAPVCPNTHGVRASDRQSLNFRL